MSEGLQLGPIGQISREVKDVAAAVEWYRDVLGLTHLYTYGELAFFDCGGVRLFLSRPEGTSTGSSIIYFKVEDIEAAHQQLTARGVVFSHPPHLIFRHENGMEEWMADFEDNEGRPLVIMAQVTAGK